MGERWREEDRKGRVSGMGLDETKEAKAIDRRCFGKNRYLIPGWIL